MPKRATLRQVNPVTSVRYRWRRFRTTRSYRRADQHWVRQVMDRDIDQAIRGLGEERCDAVEVSGELRGSRPWRTYTTLSYPDFDLCDPGAVEPLGDVVICEQVLEHVTDPWRAAETLRDLCRPGGTVIVSTPFLIRVHGHPGDFWRFTPDALRLVLEKAGLEVGEVRSWGNRRCARANFRYWRRYRPWHSLADDPLCPVVVWAVARRP